MMDTPPPSPAVGVGGCAVEQQQPQQADPTTYSEFSLLPPTVSCVASSVETLAASLTRLMTCVTPVVNQQLDGGSLPMPPRGPLVGEKAQQLASAAYDSCDNFDYPATPNTASSSNGFSACPGSARLAPQSGFSTDHRQSPPLPETGLSIPDAPPAADSNDCQEIQGEGVEPRNFSHHQREPNDERSRVDPMGSTIASSGGAACVISEVPHGETAAKQPSHFHLAESSGMAHCATGNHSHNQHHSYGVTTRRLDGTQAATANATQCGPDSPYPPDGGFEYPLDLAHDDSVDFLGVLLQALQTTEQQPVPTTAATLQQDSLHEWAEWLVTAAAAAAAEAAAPQQQATPESLYDQQLSCLASLLKTSSLKGDLNTPSVETSKHTPWYSLELPPKPSASSGLSGSDGHGNELPSNCLEVERRNLFDTDAGLNLSLFKALECQAESSSAGMIGVVHDRKNCPFYHSDRDRRRLPVFYRAEQCDSHFDFDNEGSFCVCAHGDECDRCHNRHELLYHPKIYKQRFCSSYKTMQTPSGTCHRGQFCAFAHSRQEIRCSLFTEEEERNPTPEFFMNRFKTFWCPYGIQHDWHGCLYAHTYQDCRRCPGIGYGSEPCPYWQKDLHSADYHKRCPFGARCPYAHGSKEQLYHPGYYKSMPCADFKTRRSCPRGSFCAFYHDLSEKRRGSEEGDAYNYTSPVPAGKIVYLQENFMAPPLFNLDDFEAFGHYSRAASGECRGRGSRVTTATTAATTTTTTGEDSSELLTLQKQRIQQHSGSRRRKQNHSGGGPSPAGMSHHCRQQALLQQSPALTRNTPPQTSLQSSRLMMAGGGAPALASIAAPTAMSQSASSLLSLTDVSLHLTGSGSRRARRK